MFWTSRRARQRRLAEEVDRLDPQQCRPGGPAIAIHLIRHTVYNQGARRRDASDEENQSPRRSSGGGMPPRRSTAGFGVGALSSSGVGPHQRKPDQRRRTQTPKATWPRPKATATSRRPKTHPENTVPKVNFGDPTVKLFHNLKPPRLRLRELERPRLQILCRSRPREILSEHATSDPTPLPPLVTVRAGT